MYCHSILCPVLSFYSTNLIEPLPHFRLLTHAHLLGTPVEVQGPAGGWAPPRNADRLARPQNLHVNKVCGGSCVCRELGEALTQGTVKAKPLRVCVFLFESICSSPCRPDLCPPSCGLTSSAFAHVAASVLAVIPHVPLRTQPGSPQFSVSSSPTTEDLP